MTPVPCPALARRHLAYSEQAAGGAGGGQRGWRHRSRGVYVRQKIECGAYCRCPERASC